VSFDESRLGAPGGLSDEGLRPRPALRRIAAIAEAAASLSPGDTALAQHLRDVGEIARRALASTPGEGGGGGRGGRQRG